MWLLLPVPQAHLFIAPRTSLGIVLTGGSKGLGKALAREMLLEGAGPGGAGRRGQGAGRARGQGQRAEGKVRGRGLRGLQKCLCRHAPAPLQATALCCYLPPCQLPPCRRPCFAYFTDPGARLSLGLQA